MAGCLLYLLCFLMVHSTHGARRVDAKLRANEVMRNKITSHNHYRKRSTESAEMTVKDLLRLNDQESMTTIREIKTAQGTKIRRLQEKYKGIPIYDTAVAVEVDEEGKLTGDASGLFVQGIDDDLPSVMPLFSPQEALLIALKEEGDDNSQKYIKRYTVKNYIYIGDKDLAHFVYFVDYVIINSEEIPRRPTIIIDAQIKGGKLIQKWNNLMTFSCGRRTYKAYGGNEKIGRLKYGNIPYCLQPTIHGDKCYLENEYVRVIDMDSPHSLTTNNTAFFKCKNGYDDEINGAFSPAIDAFYFGTAVGKMFEEWFESRPMRQKVVLKVHYGTNMERAFWDGEYCNFGDGAKKYYPFTSMDVVGHEIGHGVTEQASGLEYRHESGGLNEAFSDILGEATELFIRGKTDMKVAKDIMKIHFLRDFRDPRVDGSSINHVKNVRSFMDPHYSSGVYRRVFYVLTQQKGADIRPATHAFLHANRMYWRERSGFQDAGCDLLKAAYDLGQNPTPYVRALNDVGVNTCDLLSYIRSLSDNNPISGITVNSEIKPMFVFKTPSSADSVAIEASSLQGNVKITVRVGTWENDEEGREKLELFKEGYNILNVEGVNGKMLFTELSVDDQYVLNDVTVRAGISKHIFSYLEQWIRNHFFSFDVS